MDVNQFIDFQFFFFFSFIDGNMNSKLKCMIINEMKESKKNFFFFANQACILK